MIVFHEPPRTGFEITWSFFGIRFRVLPSFFLFSALLAWVFVRQAFPNGRTLVIGIAVDVACIFLVLAFTGLVQGLVYRSYGIRSAVVIQEFGSGVYPEYEPASRLQRIVAAASSPVASWLLFAIVYYSNQEWQWRELSPYAGFAYIILLVITAFWGILGFIPMFPYPGGRILMELFTFLSPRYGIQWTLLFSILLGVALIADTVVLLVTDRSYIPYVNQLGLFTRILMGIFFAMTTFRNWELLQMFRAQNRDYRVDDDRHDDRPPWER